jgi:hypothetical protein
MGANFDIQMGSNRKFAQKFGEKKFGPRIWAYLISMGLNGHPEIE